MTTLVVKQEMRAHAHAHTNAYTTDTRPGPPLGLCLPRGTHLHYSVSRLEPRTTSRQTWHHVGHTHKRLLRQDNIRVNSSSACPLARWPPTHRVSSNHVEAQRFSGCTLYLDLDDLNACTADGTLHNVVHTRRYAHTHLSLLRLQGGDGGSGRRVATDFLVMEEITNAQDAVTAKLVPRAAHKLRLHLLIQRWDQVKVTHPRRATLIRARAVPLDPHPHTGKAEDVAAFGRYGRTNDAITDPTYPVLVHPVQEQVRRVPTLVPHAAHVPLYSRTRQRWRSLLIYASTPPRSVSGRGTSGLSTLKQYMQLCNELCGATSLPVHM